VTYNAQECLEANSYLNGIIMGEGEETLIKLLNHYKNTSQETKSKTLETPPKLEEIHGITFRNEEGIIQSNQPADLLNIDHIPFPYDDEDDFTNRIVYYESSRGCPFSCSYCLSSIEKAVRFRNLEKVKQELTYLLTKKVGQVKFVDRTFNLDPNRTRNIWKFIQDHDNGITNFHFEISADLLNEEDYQLLRTLRKGLVQFEIGIQSTNPNTLHAIQRKSNLSQIKTSINKIKEGNNVHQHLDLIVGLPYEDYESSRQSFQDVYQLKPEQIQLGFLKVLRGSPIQKETKDHDLLHQPRPPYEVLSTKWLTYSDLTRLKTVEEMLDIYYNSGQFKMAISYLEHFYKNPIDLFHSLGEYYSSQYKRKMSHSRMQRYEILLDFYIESIKEETGAFTQLLLFDLYRREDLKKRPDFADEEDKKVKRDFYEKEENIINHLPNYINHEKKQVIRMTHLEKFSVDIFNMATKGEVEYREVYVLFDYQERDPLTNDARMIRLLSGQTTK
jgi:radical SAM superfamily enzyme YgiQ (UPF0313 family)